jgi:predicted nuclease with TOPRIM domain
MDPVRMLEFERAPRSVRQEQVLDMDEATLSQMARLSSDVQHIQSDVADIKVSVRRVDDRLDALNGRFDILRDKIDESRAENSARVYQLEEKLTAKIDGVHTDLTTKIDGVRTDLTTKIEAIKDKLNSMAIWAMTLYVGLAGGLLFVMAKGFKWI